MSKNKITADANKGSVRAFLSTDHGRMLILLAILVLELVLFSTNPKFLTVSNLMEAFRSYTEIGIMALGMAFVIVAGGIDLSQGSLLALVSITVGFTYRAGLPFFVSILLGVVVGICGGLFNGILVVKGNLHAFIVTLGTFSLYRGLAYGITNAEGFSDFPEGFSFIGNYYIGGVIPVQFLIYIVVAAIMWLIFRKTPYGSNISAIGYNKEAAHYAGIRVARDKIMTFVFSGLMVTIASLIYTARVFTARGNSGENMELYACAAVIMGGTDINGGKGSILGTIISTVILAMMRSGLSMLGLKNDWALFFTGLLILLSMILNQVLTSTKE